MSLPDNYSGASGETLYLGIAPLPVWLANTVLNGWYEIPGTESVIKAVAESYSGGAWTPEGRFISPAPGGHTDGALSFVAGINIGQNAPAWSYLKSPSAGYIYEQPYAPTGEPSARHSYWTPVFVPTLNAVMMTGAYAVALSGNTSFPTTDAFYLDTNQWSAPEEFGWADTPHGTYPGKNSDGTYPACANNQYYPGYANGMFSSSMVDQEGNIWSGPVDKFNPLTKVWTPNAAALANGSINVPRGPWTLDTVRNEAFGMCYGDGQGYSLNLGIVATRRKNNLVEQVTFNNSAAKTQLAADIPQYAGMTFDPVNGKYYFYCGVADRGQVGRIYEITPNSTLVWDIAILVTTGLPAPSPPSGILNRIAYIPSLGGIAMVPAFNRGVFFLRTH